MTKLSEKNDSTDEVDAIANDAEAVKEEDPVDELTDDSRFIVIAPPPMGGGSDDPKVRVVGCVGDIDEDKASEIIYGLLLMHKTSLREVPIDPFQPSLGSKKECKPFEILISTYGGSALEMFSIYDTIRRVKEDCEVGTTATGKVMSAGVLLLACGTKGKRRIGENCRVMIHDVRGGHVGHIADLENEFQEIKWIQERYIKLLARETDMTENYIKKLFKKKVNVYISAEEAVELGIADEVF